MYKGGNFDLDIDKLTSNISLSTLHWFQLYYEKNHDNRRLYNQIVTLYSIICRYARQSSITTQYSQLQLLHFGLLITIL